MKIFHLSDDIVLGIGDPTIVPRTVDRVIIAHAPLHEYSDDQPRDDHGRWSAVGGGSSAIIGKGDDLSRTFEDTKASDTAIVPIASLISKKVESPEAIARATGYMAAAHAGEGDRRTPITVTRNAEGKLEIVDGNATTQAALAAGWEKFPVREVDAHEAGINREAQVIHADAKRELPNVVARLADAFPGGDVAGRPKSVDSIVEKTLKAERETPGANVSPGALKDLIGTRVTFANQAQADAAAPVIRANFTVTREKNSVNAPVEGYRSLHFNTVENGVPTEIQLRTVNQTKWADWAHESTYKMHGTPEQVAAIEAHRGEISAYSTQMSNYYHAVDTGNADRAEKPGCSETIASTVGCL